MSEPASTTSAVPEAVSRRRWYRRPWVLLSLAGFAVLASIPFAVRGYRLSLIPDIPQPFADLPPPRLAPTKPDQVVEQFVSSMSIAGDAWYELVAEVEGFTLENRDQYFSDFDDEIRSALDNGLAEATPRVRQYLDDHEFVLQQGIDALVRVREGARPGEVYYSVARYYPDLLGLSVQRRLQSGDVDGAIDLLIEVINALENSRWYFDVGWSAGDIWSDRVSARLQLSTLVARMSELPEFREEHVRRLLVATRTLRPISTDEQLELLHASYLEDDEEYKENHCYWACAKFLSLSQWSARGAAFVLAEPELAQRLARHFYSRYRTQVGISRRERGTLRTLPFADGADWVSGLHMGTIDDATIEKAVRRSPMFCVEGVTIRGWLGFFDLERHRISQFQTAIACQLYLRKTGSLPTNLEALVPDDLLEVPLDPFSSTGSPLIYRQTSEAEAELYSVGKNGIDDGGVFRRGSVRRNEYDPGCVIRNRIGFVGRVK